MVGAKHFFFHFHQQVASQRSVEIRLTFRRPTPTWVYLPIAVYLLPAEKPEYLIVSVSVTGPKNRKTVRNEAEKKIGLSSDRQET